MSAADVTYDPPLVRPRFRVFAMRFGLAAGFAAALLTASAMIAASAVMPHASPRAGAVAERARQTPLPYTPHELVVGYSGSLSATMARIRKRGHVAVAPSRQVSLTPHEVVLELPPTASVTRLAATVRALPSVRYAVPDYVAHTAGNWFPNDPGRSGIAKGWEGVQWNFLAASGVNAPQAWSNLFAVHRAGAKGVVIAVVDTGVAFRNWHNFKRSPDFRGTRFVYPCDLVVGTIRNGHCTNTYPLDREGHGTFVTGMLAEATNNHYGLTGLAYGASIMPVRVLDANGNGDSSAIANGIRYAVHHGAQVINLSIEFSPGTNPSQIPTVVSAINYAYSHGAVIVAASGNNEGSSIDYPAALPNVVSVGATTKDRCLAMYSDTGKGLDLVAPGGGDDATSVPGSVCHPARQLPDVFQMTFADPAHPNVFSLPNGWFGTSMAAPHVTAAAAMVIASGVLGQHPSPAAVLSRLEATASPLGSGIPNEYYGYGLINIGAATSPGGPLTPSPVPPTGTSTTARR